MCGIVGILGTHQVTPLILEALKRLEYRGYDSAGIATVSDGTLDRRRAVGKLINLSDTLVHDPLPGKSGIGHTRWATHGAPNTVNAHPHRSGPVAVVHNGIIENFRVLRAELAAQGIAHESDTDTETVAHLVRVHLDRGLSPEAAVEATLQRLEGAFALAFLFEGADDLMIGARKGSPLCVGHGDGEMYLGSDALALAPLTDRITYLEEGDRVVLTRAGCTVRDAQGRLANRPVQRIRLDQTRVDRGGYRHFMAKEIAEQPSVLQTLTSFYKAPDAERLELPQGVDFASADRVTLVACGTGHYACQIAKYWFEQLAGLGADTDIASEYRYRQPVLSDRGVAIFVSQSGETADTLAALRHVKGKVARTLAVVNVPTASIAREADVALPIHAGPEISVASTKGFTAQLAVLLMLALKAGLDRGRLTEAEVAAHLATLAAAPGLVRQALDCEGAIEALAQDLAGARDVLFLGRGPMAPLALEAALKMKELSYIHAEGYASGELKHGPIALIDAEMPVIVLAPRDGLFDKTVSNMQEVQARAGKVILISDRKGIAEAGPVWRALALPEVPDLLAPIAYAIPAQLLAYHTAVARRGGGGGSRPPGVRGGGGGGGGGGGAPPPPPLGGSAPAAPAARPRGISRQMKGTRAPHGRGRRGRYLPVPVAARGPMTATRRSLILGGAAAVLAGCGTRPDSPAGPVAPITLEGAFAGRAVGAGVFRIDLTGQERRFTARLDGRLVGERLTVVEDFVYDDGEENRLTWVFDRAGPGRWTGRREDTVGEAEVRELGSEVRLAYQADFRAGSEVTRLGFEDVIYFGADGRVINDAIVTRWGIPVGRVRFVMVRS